MNHCCSHDQPPHGSAEARDPVCGMSVKLETSEHRAAHAGVDYAFCSASCKARFEADPEGTLNPPEGKSASSDTRIYTCPMHPEVRQAGPGSCPKCGMGLEPAETSLEEEDDSEYRDMLRRFVWSLLFTVPLVILAMS